MNFILCAGLMSPSSSPEEPHHDDPILEGVNDNHSASLPAKVEELQCMFIQN